MFLSRKLFVMTHIATRSENHTPRPNSHTHIKRRSCAYILKERKRKQKCVAPGRKLVSRGSSRTPFASPMSSDSCVDVRAVAPFGLEHWHWSDALAAAGWCVVEETRTKYALTNQQLKTAPTPLAVYDKRYVKGTKTADDRLVTVVTMKREDFNAGWYSRQWIQESDLRAIAISLYGSEEKMEQKIKLRNEALQKSSDTKKRKVEDREAQFTILEEQCGASREDIDGETHRGDMFFKMLDKFIKRNDPSIEEVCTELCKLKFLEKYTTYLDDYEIFNFFKDNMWPRRYDEHNGALEQLALRPHGGLWPWFWPWLSWSPEVHRFASDEGKEAVREWLRVASRMKVAAPVSMQIISAAMMMSCNKK